MVPLYGFYDAVEMYVIFPSVLTPENVISSEKWVHNFYIYFLLILSIGHHRKVSCILAIKYADSYGHVAVATQKETVGEENFSPADLSAQLSREMDGQLWPSPRRLASHVNEAAPPDRRSSVRAADPDDQRPARPAGGPAPTQCDGV